MGALIDLTDTLRRFRALRDRVHSECERIEAEECPGKSYEGEMSVIVRFPGIHPDAYEKVDFGITLDCYLLGPGRHYQWHGATLSEALDKAEKDVNAWIAERSDDD